ncbi:MAG TPA: Hsp20/alpha crystallin family protein [Pyrinomonadaceae bacterium]|jgi:HSP20 family protein|nr:Hsp20/alpha crystallin family protein [Pyrinomonadaceae bacterium]
MIKPARATGLERLELHRLRDRVGRLFAALQEATVADDPLASETWAPPVDLCETVGEIVLRVELPGLTADQIKVGATNSQLRIWGEKKRRVPRSKILSHLCSERSYGKFCRLVPLRWTVGLERATADVANGILTVRLPKIQDRRGVEFKIPVRDEAAE